MTRTSRWRAKLRASAWPPPRPPRTSHSTSGWTMTASSRASGPVPAYALTSSAGPAPASTGPTVPRSRNPGTALTPWARPRHGRLGRPGRGRGDDLGRAREGAGLGLDQPPGHLGLAARDPALAATAGWASRASID